MLSAQHTAVLGLFFLSLVLLGMCTAYDINVVRLVVWLYGIVSMFSFLQQVYTNSLIMLNSKLLTLDVVKPLH